MTKLTEEQKNEVLRKSQPLNWGDLQENPELITFIEQVIAERVREAEQKAVERFIEGAKLGIKSTNDLWLEQMSAITEIMSTDKLLEKVTGSLDKLKELSQLQDNLSEKK